MKISVNTVKQYTSVNLTVDELVEKINRQLGGVENILDLGARYEGAVITKVVTCVKHPNADKLSVCEIDAGKKTPLQVVCGAPNVRAGMYVVWLPPGSTVPASFLDEEPFVLGARELRGVVSNGMLASSKELGIGTSHDGILEIDPNEWKPNNLKIKPGTSFAAAYGLDDTIIDIENKMFTHRPDCFGQLGVAREIAGIQHQPFTSPEWYRSLPDFTSGDGLDLTVKNDAVSKVPRFMAIALGGIEIKPSPLWLQVELVRLGGKPINNIVDVTNYIMLLTAQPLHAYDYDKLRGNMLGTRFAKKGETIALLNDKTYTLTPDDIVIVDGQGPVGLGGVMGGRDSEVDENTKNIVLECATFDMYAVRKSSMRHGLFTDAVTRFNKGQSPLQNAYVIHLALQFIHDTAGGTVASHVFDNSAPHKDHEKLTVHEDFINERLGLSLTARAYADLLENVEFTVSVKNKQLSITVPYWRTDIELPEDIVEEVGRLYGFEKLPRVLPIRSMKPAPRNSRRELKQSIREVLSRAGANEVLTYSFVHEKVLRRAEQDVTQAFQLSNALSPDLQYYRLSVLPSLLDKVHGNIKAGYDEFTLFELGKGHNKKHHATDDDGLPGELEFVDLVYTSKRSLEGAAYFKARRYVEQLGLDLGLGKLMFIPIRKPLDFPVTAPFDHARSALIETENGEFLGIVGELKSSVRITFKLPEYSAAASLDFEGLSKAHTSSLVRYEPLSRFPAISQDLSLKVPTTVSYQSLTEVLYTVLKKQANGQNYTLTLLDIYQPKDGKTKTITFRLTLTDSHKTLTTKEVTVLVDKLSVAAHEELDAVQS